MWLFVVFACISVVLIVLSSVADFSNTEARAPTSAGRAPILPREERCGLCMCFECGHGYLSMAVLFSSIEATLIEEQQ